MFRSLRGGGDQPDLAVIERIDEEHEAPGLVAAVRVQRGDVLKEEDADLLGEGQVVGRSQRLLAEFGETEAGAAVGGLRDMELAAEDVEVHRLAAIGVCEPDPEVLEARVGLRRDGCQEGLMRLDAAEAVVGRAVQRDDIEALADKRDDCLLYTSPSPRDRG